MTRETEVKNVKWAMMEYSEVSKNGWLQDVIDHVRNLHEDKREDYFKYLTGMCNFPAKFMSGGEA